MINSRAERTECRRTTRSEREGLDGLRAPRALRRAAPPKPAPYPRRPDEPQKNREQRGPQEPLDPPPRASTPAQGPSLSKTRRYVSSPGFRSATPVTSCAQAEGDRNSLVTLFGGPGLTGVTGEALDPGGLNLRRGVSPRQTSRATPTAARPRAPEDGPRGGGPKTSTSSERPAASRDGERCPLDG